MANRLKGTPAEARVWAKTGSMFNIRTLSGYVVTADDEPLAFSFLANNFTRAVVADRRDGGQGAAEAGGVFAQTVTGLGLGAWVSLGSWGLGLGAWVLMIGESVDLELLVARAGSGQRVNAELVSHVP